MATDLAEILGATVMPHVIYLHSALLQGRVLPKSEDQARRLYRFTRIDVVIAMSLAGLINVAMLVVAASTFFESGLPNVDSLEGAHKTLTGLLGGASSTLFALALLGSGLSSSTVGTLAGLVVIGVGLDPSRTLVISQVVLSFGIPFALIPLVIFTSKREVMGILVNRRATIAAATL